MKRSAEGELTSSDIGSESLSSAHDTHKRCKPTDLPTDNKSAAEDEEGNDSSDAEEGEIVEEDEQDPMVRAGKAWALDLAKPPRSRVVPSPLIWSCSKGDPIPGGLWLEFGVFSGRTITDVRCLVICFLSDKVLGWFRRQLTVTSRCGCLHPGACVSHAKTVGCLFCGTNLTSFWVVSLFADGGLLP